MHRLAHCKTSGTKPHRVSGLLSALVAVLLEASGPAAHAAEVGYGYKKGQDPLTLGVKRIVLAARSEAWEKASKEARDLDWQFDELRNDLEIDLEASFLRAVESESLDDLSRAVARLVFQAVRQKLHWNIKEELEHYVRAKSRVEAARDYYADILAIGVQRYDEIKKTTHHKSILEAFDGLLKSVGSPGLFGINARPADLAAFRKHERAVLSYLEDVYPYATAAPAPDGGDEASPDRSNATSRRGAAGDRR